MAKKPAVIATLLALNLLFLTCFSVDGATQCPPDALQLGACVNVLNLLNLKEGKPPKEPCCSLVGNIADVEAAACFCTALKANILGVKLNLPVSLSLLVNYCGSGPSGYECP
uniref:Uncharacterized protein n=1 Tax=Avena sativa TaxID=4498 RepID=A0ACD5WH41_AVESA